MTSLFYLVIFLLFSSVYSYKTFSRNETEPYRVKQMLDYGDRTVTYLTKAINQTCNEPNIDLRIIHQNGTTINNPVRFNHSIPDFNFCHTSHITLFNKLENLIILYKNSTNIYSSSFYALIINIYNGDLISDSFLSHVPVIDGKLSNSADIYVHTNEKYGFLFRTFVTYTKMLLNYYSNPSGNLELINSNEVELYSQSKFNIFPMIDGTFGLVTSNYTTTNHVSNNEDSFEIIYNKDTFDVTLSFHLFFVNPWKNSSIDDPVFLYGTEKYDLNSDFECDFAYTTSGYTCTLNLKENQPIGKPINRLFKLDFKSTGSVIGNEFLNFESEDDIIESKSLRHGGYLVLSSKDHKNYKTIQATVLNDNGTYNSTLLPEDLNVPNDFVVSYFKNDTFVVARQQENEYNWEISLAEYPQFKKYDNGCDAPNIQSVYPLVDSYIPLGLTNANITYDFPVVMSSINNISIYQHNNGDPILRQSIRGGDYLNYSADNKTLKLNILNSTFNQPDEKYYVLIDDNAVQDRIKKEALTGIQSNIWKFNTVHDEYDITGDATGLVALTTEATKFYDDLDRHNKNEYHRQLRIELAKSIPTNISRLGNAYFYKYDERRAVLALSVKSASNRKDPNVEQIFDNLNVLIRNKDITPISRFDSTKNLDHNFGFIIRLNWFYESKYIIIGIVFTLQISIPVFLILQWKNLKGENVVLLIPLFVVNFVSILLFIINHGKDPSNLIIASIVFVVIPIIANITMTVVILFKEMVINESLREWYKSNLIPSILCTVSTVIDIKILKTIYSQVASTKTFNAPVTKKMRYYLIWGGLVGFIMGDIPRFIIQIIYILTMDTYDTISSLSFLMSFLVLICNLIFSIYIIIYLYKKYNKKRRIFDVSEYTEAFRRNL